MSSGGPQGQLHPGAQGAAMRGRGGLHQPTKLRPSGGQRRQVVDPVRSPMAGLARPSQANPQLAALLHRLPPPSGAPGSAILQNMLRARALMGGR